MSDQSSLAGMDSTTPPPGSRVPRQSCPLLCAPVQMYVRASALWPGAGGSDLNAKPRRGFSLALWLRLDGGVDAEGEVACLRRRMRRHARAANYVKGSHSDNSTSKFRWIGKFSQQKLHSLGKVHFVSICSFYSSCDFLKMLKPKRQQLMNHWSLSFSRRPEWPVVEWAELSSHWSRLVGQVLPHGERRQRAGAVPAVGRPDRSLAGCQVQLLHPSTPSFRVAFEGDFVSFRG